MADKYHFFVDGKQYETNQPNLTGAQIKAMVTGFNPAYQLFLEEHGDHPDRPVADTENISLDPAHHGVRKFYSVPPATFGRQ
jgi:hypothetical protein